MPFINEKILITPLDWGLGHATRCIPIIEQLFISGFKKHQIEIASSGRSLELLKQEYPFIKTHKISSYDISYQEKGSLASSMFLQLPKLIRKIRKEHKQIKKIVEENAITIIISDNRYGAYHERTRNIFITHQLNIQTPKYLTFLKPLIKQTNFSYIKKFDQCWIPDLPAPNHISGQLSEVFFDKPTVKHLGCLSRCYPLVIEKKFDLLVIISGPEPQRSIFEEIVFQQITETNLKIAVVLGKPEVEKACNNLKNMHIFNHLNSKDMNQLMNESEIILSRAGYSTIMDVIALNKKAILIPTPGQTEQEYLGEFLMKKEWFYSCQQNELKIKEAIKMASSYESINLTSSLLKETIENFLQS